MTTRDIDAPVAQGGLTTFTAEQDAFRAEIRDFVARELPPGTSRKHDAEESFPIEKLRRFAELGYLGVGIPTEYGGRGGGFVDLAIMLEELAKGMMSFALMVFRSAVHGAQTFLRLEGERGEELRRRYLPLIARCEARFSLSLSEDDAGSDASNVQLRALRDGEHFVLNGKKHYSSALDVATHIIVVTRTTEGVRHSGFTLFLVETSNPGLELHRLHALGDRASGTFDVVYQDARVHESEMIGELNGGWQHLMADLEKERLCQCAYSAGGAQAVLAQALDYAKTRQQFGQPIGKFQVIQHKLANMATDCHLGRLLLYDLARRIDAGQRCDLEASMAKLFCTEMYNRVADTGLQVHGGEGYMMHNDMQQHFRDARLLTIGGGTVEIMRNVIAKRLGL